MNHQEIIDKTVSFVKESLQEAEGGHDWWHIQRVRKTALTIAKEENVDEFVVELASLLHDIADSKFHDSILKVNILENTREKGFLSFFFSIPYFSL